MTRRIVRSAVQLALVAGIVFFLVVFLDNSFDVLPRAIHNHLPAHNHGHVVTDITIKTCSKVSLFSSCKLSSTEWHRIDKDLYLETGWVTRAYLHVKLKREEELTTSDKVVMDLRVSRLNPSTEKQHSTESWESRPSGLWLLRSSKRHDSDSKRAITAIDVLFGHDAADPRTGWTMMPTALLLNNDRGDLEAHVTARSGTPKSPFKPSLKVNPHSDKFKIMQAADLHLSTGVGKCRDTESNGECDADTRTLDFTARLLDDEHPDLVILTGDQVNGETARDPQSTLLKMADVFIKRKIPFACIFGNHDDTGPMHLTRSESMSILEGLPYSLSVFGPTAVHGVGNYVLEVEAPGTTHNSAISLYLLDTHSYSPNEKQFPGYNWIKDDQIGWFKSKTEALKKKHGKYSKIHLDMAFIHIPLPEYKNADRTKLPNSYREDVTAPAFNSHFKDALVEDGVRLVTAGHDHVNDYCALDKSKDGKPQLWMCYGGGAGFGGYGGHGGYTRRMRFFEFDINGGNIRTWKRLEQGDTKKKIDLQTVVEGGKLMEN